MTAPTVAEVAAALHENEHKPFGPTRSARAEELTELAAQTGDRPLTIQALQEQIRCHEYDGERDKLLVPFARVFRMWDENPADFDRAAAYRLYWHFKWVTLSMVRHPNVPLDAVRHWLGEMQGRYRQAGYGMHAVYACQFTVAAHVGDLDEAHRTFAAWTAAARDEMSDCDACDRADQAGWHATIGRDARALEVWQPILVGELQCQEEPHQSLANSLLPLLRLGRYDEARANHLRGYRMVRGKLSLRRSVGLHLEFAALTGNEGRGLEMLADHAAWLHARNVSAGERLAFLEGVAVLLRRLVALGHSDLAVATPGGTTATTPVHDLSSDVEREVADLAGRFDERNGTSAVSDRCRVRLDAAPLVEALPLGIRSAAIGVVSRLASVDPPDEGTAPATSGTRAADPAGDAGPDLVSEAKALTDRRHPDGHAAWERVAASGIDRTPEIDARIAESRALHDASAGAARDRSRSQFLDVARRFTEVGDAGRVAINRGRAALAATLAGDVETGARESAAVLTEIADLPINDRDRMAARAIATRERLARWLHGGAPADGHPALVIELTALAQDADGADEPYHAGGALLLLGRLALATQDHDLAHSHLQASVARYLAADTPWETAHALTLLASLALSHDDPVGAERHVMAAFDHGAGLLDPAVRGNLYRLRATARFHQGGRDRDVVDDALHAAHLLDASAPDDAVRARWQAAVAFQRDGRLPEAAALLEAVHADAERYITEHEVIEIDRLLAQCQTGLGEYREAAETLVRIAGVVQAWPNQTAHATIAHELGDALDRAGLTDRAGQSYERAAGLWRDLGSLADQVRATRAQAWVKTRGPGADWPGAYAVMQSAQALVADAGPEDPELVGERYETLLQAAEMLQDWPEAAGRPDFANQRGLAAAHEAAVGLVATNFTRAAEADLVAANYEATYLDRTEAAAARLRRLGEECRRRGADALARQCEEFLGWLERRPRG